MKLCISLSFVAWYITVVPFTTPGERESSDRSYLRRKLRQAVGGHNRNKRTHVLRASGLNNLVRRFGVSFGVWKEFSAETRGATGRAGQTFLLQRYRQGQRGVLVFSLPGMRASPLRTGHYVHTTYGACLLFLSAAFLPCFSFFRGTSSLDFWDMVTVSRVEFTVHRYVCHRGSCQISTYISLYTSTVHERLGLWGRGWDCGVCPDLEVFAEHGWWVGVFLQGRGRHWPSDEAISM